MAQDEKQWHPRFLKYMREIVNHPNYKGLPIKKKPDGSYAWIATAKSEIGQQRINWCIRKAQELGLTRTNEAYPGMYADVMLEIHPTKWKVCQICGKEMSLCYHYPNANFATVYKGNIIKNLIMDCQSYTKYRPNETTGGIFVSWRRKEELPTGA